MRLESSVPDLLPPLELVLRQVGVVVVAVVLLLPLKEIFATIALSLLAALRLNIELLHDVNIELLISYMEQTEGKPL